MISKFSHFLPVQDWVLSTEPPNSLAVLVDTAVGTAVEFADSDSSAGPDSGGVAVEFVDSECQDSESAAALVLEVVAESDESAEAAVVEDSESLSLDESDGTVKT